MDEGTKRRIEAKVEAIQDNLARLEDTIDVIKAWAYGIKRTLEEEQ